MKSIPGELQISAPVGSVYLKDTRMALTRSTRASTNDGGSGRYAPWWCRAMSLQPTPGGHTLRTYVPRVRGRFSPDLQLLYGIWQGAKTLQPNQLQAVRAQGLHSAERPPDNSQVVVGDMTHEQWRRRSAKGPALSE